MQITYSNVIAGWPPPLGPQGAFRFRGRRRPITPQHRFVARYPKTNVPQRHPPQKDAWRCTWPLKPVFSSASTSRRTSTSQAFGARSRAQALPVPVVSMGRTHKLHVK